MATAATAPSPGDLVEAIFSVFPQEEPVFTTDTEAIHRSFYDLKQEYPEVFARFIFDKHESFPYCESIEFAMGCLAGGALLQTQNPYLDTFSVPKSLRKHRSPW